MTPRDKAIQLIEQFTKNIPYHPKTYASSPRQCAYVCVDELINSTQPKSRMFRYNEYCTEYWQEVKSEIDKL